jgi:hypothetical protein
LFWEEVDGVRIACGCCAGDVAVVASVVIKGWAYVPSVCGVGSEGCSVVGILVDHNSGSWWSKGCGVEVENSMDGCMSGDAGVYPGRA